MIWKCLYSGLTLDWYFWCRILGSKPWVPRVSYSFFYFLSSLFFGSFIDQIDIGSPGPILHNIYISYICVFDFLLYALGTHSQYCEIHDSLETFSRPQLTTPPNPWVFSRSHSWYTPVSFSPIIVTPSMVIVDRCQYF